MIGHIIALVSVVVASSDRVNITLYGKLIEANLLDLPRIPVPVMSYVGIPFAEPPVGPLRLQPPVRKNFYDVPSDLTRLRSPCIQKSRKYGEPSEDCLYLNVYVRADLKRSKRLPVMFWIHGGSFLHGSGRKYSGASLAAHESVVVVTMNYRLGHLGFLNGTNLALLDQRMALEWVRDHISKFGGDPKQVLLFGDSAGAACVLWHMVADKSKKLFSAAAVQSAPITDFVFQSLENNQKYSEWYSNKVLGCQLNDTICLQNVPADKFAWKGSKEEPSFASPLYPLVPVGPVVDGIELTESPLETLKKTNVTIPFIIGATQHEGSAFAAGLEKIIKLNKFPPETANDTISIIQKIIRSNDSLVAQRLVDLYNMDEYLSDSPYSRKVAAFRLLRDGISDAMFLCPLREIARNQKNARVYLFSVSQLYGWTAAVPILKGMPIREMGAFHNAELGLLFKDFKSITQAAIKLIVNLDIGNFVRSLYTAGSNNFYKYHKLSDKLSCSWSQLAKCKDAHNCMHKCMFTEWPLFAEQRHILNFQGYGRTRLIDDKNQTQTRLRSLLPTDAICEAWSRVSWSWLKN